MSPDQCAHTIGQALITGHDKDVDGEPLVEFAASPVPRYTPMPIPVRMSSARTGLVGEQDECAGEGQNGSCASESGKHVDEADGASFNLEGLEEEGSGGQASSTAAVQQQQQLPALQNPLADKCDVPHTELNNVDDPDCWDVIKSTHQEQLNGVYSLEERASQLYSSEHLSLILDDPKFRLKFSNFLRKHRPWRLPVLAFYWKAYKALKALHYTNSLIDALSASTPTSRTTFAIPTHAASPDLIAVSHQAFEELRREDLHYYISHAYITIVSAVVHRRITGNLSAHLRETSHGLAEVFCITDPSRPNNPIILASQEFTRHSGCALNYILGRNCNFMQGPGTTMDSRRRFAVTCQEGRDHTEIFVNYRRDGSPFLSLVMNAPLLDSRGNVRYFLGAQVDVSGLLKECSGMASLRKLIEQQQQPPPPSPNAQSHESPTQQPLDPHREIKALSQLFNAEELDIIRMHGGYLLQGSHYVHTTTSDAGPATTSKAPRRVLIEDGVGDGFDEAKRPAAAEPGVAPKNPVENQTAGSLEGVYKHYLLVRPHPSLRILFVSPRLRCPGMLQSHFLHHISGRLRQDLEVAFREGNAVTAKVKWLDVVDERGGGEEEGRTRWVHCTPLMHYEERIGLWMVVVVGEEEVEEGVV
ncbi:hypothetical protein M409DRAFT_70603 [Zasmidium cellare ATCC 36951]|uniref:PAC domain-containing protein n=1 Tax=Zasmidium cellare ATCC 36951 TaxID=1080233 RepID=A0A6A6C321_ZASCE|nr:uncharacterized protein M409DRAFT_70603 [Zasmidium cellare ATCC 36951]KAF2160262.1 hypothetical protein M409DRAFT_70603 [Zasmidium cellare ATCC 36951]